MLVECDWCGHCFNKSCGKIDRTGHNFCCVDCYHNYRIQIGLPSGEFKTRYNG